MESLAPGENGIVVERVHEVGLHVAEELADLRRGRKRKKFLMRLLRKYDSTNVGGAFKIVMLN